MAQTTVKPSFGPVFVVEVTAVVVVSYSICKYQKLVK
jgi:hypothetical protein